MNNTIYINGRFLTQHTTGVQRFAIEITKQLITILPNVIILCPKDIIQKDLFNQFNASVIGNLTGHKWEQLELPKFLKSKDQPLLINFCNTAPLFYKNQIITIHDLAFKLHPEWFSKPFSLFYNFLIPRIIKRSKKIITVSNYSKNDILKHYPNNKTTVVYNAINDKFKPEPSNPSKKFILAVSSLDPRKNFISLVKAFKQLKDPNLELVIVGKKNTIFSNQQFEEELRHTPNIKFTGYISDEELIELYSNAECFVYPSLYEGFGIPPLEAMACNCPTIVSNTSSLPEVCELASLLVIPTNIKDITEKITLLLNNNEIRNELIIKGQQQCKKYSWKKSSQQIATIINEVSSAL